MLGSVVGLVIKKMGGWLLRMISGQEGWCISQHREPAWALSLLSAQFPGGGTWDWHCLCKMATMTVPGIRPAAQKAIGEPYLGWAAEWLF